MLISKRRHDIAIRRARPAGGMTGRLPTALRDDRKPVILAVRSAFAAYLGVRIPSVADPASSGSPTSGSPTSGSPREMVSPIKIVPTLESRSPVKISSLRAFTLIAATVGWTFPQAVAAQSQGQLPRDTTHITPAGNYLAARQANLERDADAASLYYRAALRTDQKNPEILELAFYSVLADGDIDEASRLAERLIQIDRNNRNAHLVLGVKALKAKNYKEARSQFGQAARGPVTDLTATLARRLERVRRQRLEGRGRYHRQALRPGMVRHLQGHACRPHSRPRQQQEGSGQAARAFLQARFRRRCA